MALWHADELSPGSGDFSYSAASLYVGDLQADVTESTLFEKFSQAGPILSIRICRDVVTRRSLGYGYVNFQSPADAERALNTMNFDVINGRSIRIMWCQRNPLLRKTGMGNVFVNHLDDSVDNRVLYEIFCPFGNILSCKVVCDETGHKSHGFVHFETQESAERAIRAMNGVNLNGHKLFVGKYKSPSEREGDRRARVKDFTNVYVKNIGEDMKDENVAELFSKFGPIISAKVMTDESGKSKRFGFVRFQCPEDAQKAVNEMHGKEIDSNILYVSRAQRKAERQSELKNKFEEIKQNRMYRAQYVNLYVKNLADDIDDERLLKEFSPFGRVTSVKVMTEGEHKKGFGFVCFSSPEEASKALAEMNGRIVANKPLYVSFAQSKEERQAQLTKNYIQRIASMTPMASPVFSPYQPAPPSGYFMTPMPQPQNYAAYYPPSQVTQVAPGVHCMDQDAAFHPYQNMPSAVGPATLTSPLLNTMTPAPSQPQQLILMQPPCFPNMSTPTMGPYPEAAATIPGTPPATGMPAPTTTADVISASTTPSARTALTYALTEGVRNPHQFNIPPQATRRKHAARVQCPKALIASTLASATPEEQKRMLRDWLFPIIQAMHPTLATHITGLLLEMDNSEILHMLECSESLRCKIDEALALLEAYQITKDE